MGSNAYIRAATGNDPDVMPILLVVTCGAPPVGEPRSLAAT
jgi:hypothetical protein